jgi:hypothetical protein
MQFLISTGFQTPHLALNMYINWFTSGFTPTDADWLVQDEITLKYRLSKNNAEFATEYQKILDELKKKLGKEVERHVKPLNFKALAQGRISITLVSL